MLVQFELLIKVTCLATNELKMGTKLLKYSGSPHTPTPPHKKVNCIEPFL